jgi:flagellar motor protein MotB
LTKKLDGYAKSHVGVTFDPVEKVVRFQSDTVFRDGGDRLRGDAQTALRELAAILNTQKAGQLNLLVVGHTGGGAVPDAALLVQHPTDWHLAAHQAIAVEQYLEESGLSPTRVGIISYADQQPLVPPKDDVARQKNARVEVFILPPDPPAEISKSAKPK